MKKQLERLYGLIISRRRIGHMGQILKIKVVAEGVEEEGQVDFLKSIGCEQCQGYYFSKPLSVDSFEKMYFDFISQ
jgi:EAL domain-containing protein (putative c-di-GMP-specific phosphodiesterase class I)